MGPSPLSVRSGTRVRLALALLILAVVLGVALVPDLRGLERGWLVAWSELGAFAPLLLVLLYCAGTTLLLPVFWLDLAAGAHFGFLWGVLWVQLAAGVASIGAFFVGRHAFRGPIEGLARRHRRFAALEEAVATDGWRLVLLTRLSPVLPFAILGVFYGATRIRFRPYLLASFVGMLPGTVLYVYAGDMAGDLSGAPGHPDKAPFRWWFEAGGLVATVVLVVYVTQRAQRALSTKLEKPRLIPERP